MLTAKKLLATNLLERLVQESRNGAPETAMYTQLLSEGDHPFLAFCSLDLSSHGIDPGLASTKRVFAALDFHEQGPIRLPLSNVEALLLVHEDPDFPRIVLSQLDVAELPVGAQQAIKNIVAHHEPLLSEDDTAHLNSLGPQSTLSEAMLEKVYLHFSTLPWPPPSDEAVEEAGAASAYAAWVLQHGNALHFYSGNVDPVLTDVDLSDLDLQ